MIDPKDLLTRFGFSEQEAEIYLIALRLGSATSGQIAKKSTKKRTAVYFHIHNLLEKKLLKETRRKGKKFFVPVPPRDLAAQFDRWTTDFKSVVPQLEALKRIDVNIPIIRITESYQGYVEIYESISTLPAGSMFRVFEGRDATEHELKLLSDAEWRNIFKRMVERRIETKGLFIHEALQLPKKSCTKKRTNYCNNARGICERFPKVRRRCAICYLSTATPWLLCFRKAHSF